MEKNLISVIVTCYNRSKYILDCLTSIKNQTYKNYECIIIDDGSTDNSVELINKFILNDSHFHLIAHKHVGFPEAKNIGLANRSPKSAYTIFLDSDDVAHPEWLTLLHYVCTISSAPVAVCLYDVFTETNQIKNFKLTPQTPLQLSEFTFLRLCLIYNRNCMHFMWNKLVRSDLYDTVHFEDQPALSDVAIMADVFYNAKYVVQLHLPLVHYRQHPDNMGKTSIKQGDSYWVWRLNFQKKKLRKDWERSPQTRAIIQLVLEQEIDAARKNLKEKFNTFCTLDDVQDMLNTQVVFITNKQERKK